MRLFDCIASSKNRLTVGLTGGRSFTLPNAVDIAADVTSTPLRYVLDDPVAASAAITALEDPDQLMRCIDLVRIPAPLLWLEWNERSRRMALSQLDLADHDDAHRTAGRAGLLVRSDHDGRRGEIAIAWEGEAPEPDLSPFSIHFDLDGQLRAPMGAESHIRRVEIRENESLTQVLRLAQFRMSEAWQNCYSAACSSRRQLEEVIHKNLYMIAADFPALLAFLLMLQARNAVDRKYVSMARLNKARQRRHQPPLLDHVEVKSTIGGVRCVRQQGNGHRADPRLHLVTGHLVRRGPAIFWRRSHLRGSPMRGLVSSRTVVVKMAA